MVLTTRGFAGLVVIASAAVIGAALLSQYWGGLAPCELCLLQRWPWWGAIAIAAFVWIASDRVRLPPAALILFAVFLVSAGLAFYHVGVEQHWFQGPTACTGGGGAATLEALKAQLLNRQPVNCDEPAWKLFGIVSLAGLNFLASVLLALFCIAGLRRVLAAPQEAAA